MSRVKSGYSAAVARSAWNREVAGSIPAIPTNADMVGNGVLAYDLLNSAYGVEHDAVDPPAGLAASIRGRVEAPSLSACSAAIARSARNREVAGLIPATLTMLSMHQRTFLLSTLSGAVAGAIVTFITLYAASSW